MAVAGCSSVPLKDSGTLSTYSNLGAPKGQLSKSRFYVDGLSLAPIKTVAIEATRFGFAAASRIKSPADRAMVIAGKEPKGLDLSLPSRQRMKSWLGGKPNTSPAMPSAASLVGVVAAAAMDGEEAEAGRR
ncbi:hypothetical protein GGI59_000357 [Rhizobium lentis]|uniref:DUF3313 domain-containing protein n=1 Tax=Rhizobium lentis TaxID=1138194 RepID=A0A7W8UIQ0_9HYPH|nr:hypothetical protein [Rhizobium lentis]MBB5548202.1 hypothetical protein [Rhizobium lentis]MBB5558730.1 hypothetical protein [Rhizobium lentis]MBB5565746.1 hypothetical protein [Rhizobium lentis]